VLKICKSISIITVVLAVLFSLYGFDFSKIHIPSREQIKKELQSEINKLKSLTPQARRKALWIKKKIEAIDAIKQAKIDGAPKYASNLYQEAKEYFELAIKYAKKQQYLKASYLAKECKRIALRASDKATKKRLILKQKIKLQLDKLKKQIDKLVTSLETNKTLQKKKAELILYYQDLIHALNLEQFNYIKQRIKVLKKQINELISNPQKLSNNKNNKTLTK